MKCHYTDLGSASDWLKQIYNQTEPAEVHFLELVSVTGKPVVTMGNVGC